MLGVPLLITRPEVKEVAEAVSKRTGTEVTGAHVMYDAIRSKRITFTDSCLVSPGLKSVATASSPSRLPLRVFATTSRRSSSSLRRFRRSVHSRASGSATTSRTLPTSPAGISTSSASLRSRWLSTRWLSESQRPRSSSMIEKNDCMRCVFSSGREIFHLLMYSK